MERVANLFMGRIDSMAAAQQRMMELMMGGGAMDRRGAMQPRSLAALSNGDDFVARRLPSIVFEDADGSPPRQLALAYGNFDTPPPPPGGVGSPPPWPQRRMRKRRWMRGQQLGAGSYPTLTLPTLYSV